MAEIVTPTLHIGPLVATTATLSSNLTVGGTAAVTGVATFSDNTIVAKSVDGVVSSTIRNTNTGTGAMVAVSLGNANGDSVGFLRLLGSGYTTSNYNEQDAVVLGSSRQNLHLVAENLRDIQFWTNSLYRGRFKSDGAFEVAGAVTLSSTLAVTGDVAVTGYLDVAPRATASLPAGSAGMNGTIVIDETGNLRYYSQGSRYVLSGVAF